jgi:membrane protease YdiL (CAAX protease family)
MIQAFKSFPLVVRLSLIFCILIFNLILFPIVAAFILAPFCGLDRVNAIAIGTVVTQSDKYIFLFLQGFCSLGMFAFTALLVSQLETRHVFKRLGLTTSPPFILIALALTGVLLAQAFIQFLVQINQSIPLPDALKSLLEVEKKEELLMDSLLGGNSWIMFLANALVLALIPAIGEELFFRGVLLGELLKSKINPAVAIIFTGLVFSLFHGEFSNILAIWALGSFLGYLYYVSGSLWLSVLAHFTNNFLFVLLKYLYNTGHISKELADADMPLYATLVSSVLFALCLFALNKWRKPVDFALILNEPEIIADEEQEHYN